MTDRPRRQSSTDVSARYERDLRVAKVAEKARASGRTAVGGSRHGNSLYLSAISIFESEAGVLLMQRKDPLQADVLREWLHQHILPGFSGRILAVDAEVALRCATLHVDATQPYRDSLIAATALVHGMTVVTRNVKDFVPMGVPVLNPWDA